MILTHFDVVIERYFKYSYNRAIEIMDLIDELFTRRNQDLDVSTNVNQYEVVMCDLRCSRNWANQAEINKILATQTLSITI